MRRRSTLLVAMVMVATCVEVGATQGCYGATEVRVQVTTTVPCSSSAPLTTQIFTGAPATTDFGTAPAAETSECLAAEPRVGTLSIVPSGARDDRFDLEVVGAVGVSRADCRPDALGREAGAPGATSTGVRTGCIVARRRVSYRRHQALTLPILLSAQCIGVPCGLDQTCDLGVCTPTEQCTDRGCPRERGDVAIPIGDGGTDAPVDSAIDASSPRCGSTPEVVLGGQRILGPLVMQGDDFLYVNDISAAGEDAGTRSDVRRVARAGAASAQVVIQPEPPTVPGYAAVAASPTNVAWASTSNSEMAYTGVTIATADGGMRSFNGGSGYDRPTMTLAGNVLFGFWHPNGGTAVTPFVYTYPANLLGSTSAGLGLGSAVPEVLADDESHFYGVSDPDLLVHFQALANGPTEIGRITSVHNVSGDLAVAGHTIFFAANDTTRGTGIFRVAREAIKEPHTDTPWLPTPNRPSSMTSDGASLFFLAGTTLFRVDAGAMITAAAVVTTTDASADRLQVDDQCVYWIENGTTIMKRSKRSASSSSNASQSAR